MARLKPFDRQIKPACHLHTLASLAATDDAKRKMHRPLNFQHFGGKAIRGWDEALKGMTLGEKVEVTIMPKWAYRKGGVPDDKGGYVVPPNATLVFEMQLVGVRDAKLKDEAAKHVFWGK